jgi:hypothetical protein
VGYGSNLRDDVRVSAHSFIEIGTRLLIACREGHLPELAALFTEGELHHEGDLYGYRSRADQVRDRLQLQGFTTKRAKDELDGAIQAWHDLHQNPEADAPVRGASELLEELSSFLNSSEEWVYYEEPQEVFWQLDSRTVLRLALDLVRDGATPVRYNLDDLLGYELLVPGTPITDQARAKRREKLARDAPLVVLTEGSSDSQLLTTAVGVTHPHLVGFLHFMDFSGGAEGSAANLAKLVRSFIGAGIANRVVAIADNDTAAYDALDRLKREGCRTAIACCTIPTCLCLRVTQRWVRRSTTPF